MNKRMIWLALAGVVIVAGGMSVNVALHQTHAARHDAETDADAGHSPSDGDYWAIRLGYGGDPQRLRFEPAWLLESAKQDQKIRSALPAGVHTYQRSGTEALALDANAFTLLGPQPLVGEGFGANRAAGRTNVIVSDPDNTAVAWIGADGGGVWKTTNCCTANTTWTVKTDFPEIASMAIGDLTMDPNNHNVLYAGTGDLRYGSMSFGAAGVLKSSDRGETWQLLGANVFNPIYGPITGFPQYQAIGKVVVDPNNSSNVIVGTKTGVYFSYDAGANWTGPCYTNNFSAGAGAQRQDTTGLLAVKRSTTTYLYVGVGTRGIATPVQPDLGNNGANGVYRTIMPASGCPAVASWTLLTNGFPAGTGNGTANTSRGRLELAVAPSDPLTLYAMFANVATKGILGVYKTINGGDTWTQVGTPASAGTQMWYDAGLTVSPTDPNVLFVSAVDLYRSSNGGSTYVNLTNAYHGGPVHPDNHARAIVGGDASKVLNGNDGGIYYASNALAATTPATANWTDLNKALPTIEIYHGDITANFATSANAGATGGFQDNGSASIVFNGTPAVGAWTATNGGDGIVSRIEPVLGQTWYTSIYYAAISASTTGAFGTQNDISPPLDSSDRASFFTPFDLYRNGVLDAPGSGCTSAAGCTHIILGTQRVWESTDGGLVSWSAKTGDLSKNNLIVGTDNRSYINQIHYSVSDPTIAMAATSDGNVQYVFGLGGAGAATAVDVTGSNAVLPNRPMQDVATDPVNPLHGYAAVGGFTANTPTTPGHVFQVTCTAQCASFTWVDKSGNLPDIPANAVIANPRNPNQVFVGMDWGLYYTDDISVATPVWQRFEGLPHVMVWSLSTDRGFTTLAAFTRSRGAWVWPLPAAPLGSADLEVSIAPPAFAEPGTRVAYTVTVTNHGPDTASNVQLTSPTPSGLTFAGNSGDCTSAYPCTLASLASGATQIITTSLCVPHGYAGANPIALSAAASSAAFDSVASNNGMSVNVGVLVDSVFVDGFETCP
jgi:uncharacterized repeat protein (TIGR01451 family)